ncbi:MAG: hypothetical protein CBB71_09225 [Rhodopirellula sp. TMED11]|nr:MAG: hypothetical protein CBB71_09225 [Rhodopirellula sp. TMED11]
MSWISMLTPVQWALFSLIPAGIILLYFLKLRREPVQIPSTFLWARTVEDLHVNSLFQRIRKNLLLFLQLLAILLAAFALLSPGFRGERSNFGRTIYLLDTSASMMADDVDDAENRFEAARKQIRERIDTMSSSDTAMLITFSDRSEVMQSYTGDRAKLRDALNRVQLTNRTTDIYGALKAADGLANPRRSSTMGDTADIQVADAMNADLVIYSDGGFPDVSEFNVGNLAPTYIRIGSDDVENVGIVAFTADRNIETPDEVKAYGTVVNYGKLAQSFTLSLYVNGQWRDSTGVQLDPGEESGISFPLTGQEDAASIEIRLENEDDLPYQDALPLDNVAYAGLRPMRTVSVLLITEGNRPMEVGMSTANAKKMSIVDVQPTSYLDSEEYAARASSGLDDLIVYDRCQPKDMPATNTFFIGALPSNEWEWTSDPGQVLLIDSDRTHPLMRYLELYSLLIFEGRSVKGPEGTQELLASDSGAVLSLAPREGFQDLVLAFEIISTDDEGNLLTNTNWFSERSWPVFLLNVLRHLAGAADESAAGTFRPGETVRLRVASELPEVDIARGSGTPETVMTGSNGIIQFVDTDAPGVYQVTSGEGDEQELVEMFCINLFSSLESNVTPRQNFDLGYEAIQAEGTTERRMEYWRWLLLIVLLVLAGEWWLYNHRIA